MLSGHDVLVMAVLVSFPVIGLDQFLRTAPSKISEQAAGQIQNWLADSLLARVRENVANEFEELMWGSPGTMLIACALHEWTGEERWAAAWRESADALMARRGPDGLWTQQLYGTTHRLLGPVHGLVGNVHALLQLGEARPAVLERHDLPVQQQRRISR